MNNNKNYAYSKPICSVVAGTLAPGAGTTENLVLAMPGSSTRNSASKRASQRKVMYWFNCEM